MPEVIINRNKCEGKAVCLKVCPEAVLEMGRPTGLPLLTRLRVRVHGGEQVFAVRADACTACMKCVDACPEQAISVIA